MSDSSRNVITSVELSKSLDNDYSEDKLKNKIQNNKTFITKFYDSNMTFNISSTGCLFLVGSKAEGMSNYLESDWDIMEIDNSIICSEHVELLTHESKQVLKLDRTDAPAGYCFLYSTDTYTKIRHLLDVPGNVYSISGPARTFCLNGSLTSRHLQDDFHQLIFGFVRSSSFDHVFALPCELPDLRMAWCERRRNYDWPSQESIQNVATLPAYAVPVGVKGSENQDYQWRICFTLAELHLVQSLNNTQAKVNVCLKRLAKHYFKPINDDITSYVIKNVILWLAESMPSEKFKPEFLIDRIEDGLQFLKTTVEDKCLRNYMIPERNLFMNKLENNGPLLVAINKILPLKLYRSKQIMSPEVRTYYNMMCIVETGLWFGLALTTFEQIRDWGIRLVVTGGKHTTKLDIELD